MRVIILLSLLYFISPALSQNPKWLSWRAQTKINAGAYQDAAVLYHRALAVDSAHYKSNLELGKVFLYEFELFDSSEFYIARAMRHPLADQDYGDHYARALQLNENPSLAIMHYKLYQGYVINLKNNEALLALADEHIKTCENAIVGIEAQHKVTT